MIPLIKSELRKLLTVRSTYFIVIISLLIVVFFAGYIVGFKSPAEFLKTTPDLLQSQSTDAMIFVGFILAFAGLLLVGHEYRFNTIMYTLTSANRRSKVFLSKFLVISTFALLVAMVVAFFSPAMTIVGAKLAGHELGPQQFDAWSVLWRCLFVAWGYAMYAFILMMLLRNQIGAIVTFLLLPLMGEGILTLLLKTNAAYLPFTALQSVGMNNIANNPNATMTSVALAVLTYISVGLIASAVLFIKRDAN